jgi:hypothetical protein
VMYSKGVLGTARILVNYSKDDIKARKRLRCYLMYCKLLSQMPIPDAGLESLEMTSFSLVIQTSLTVVPIRLSLNAETLATREGSRGQPIEWQRSWLFYFGSS